MATPKVNKLLTKTMSIVIATYLILFNAHFNNRFPFCQIFK